MSTASVARDSSMRLHDWAFFATIAALALLIAALLRGALVWAIVCGILALAAWTTLRTLSRRHPGPMPYSLRWTLFLVPHAAGALKRVLEPKPGERMLEIGPGLGHHALPIASSLRPDGVLHVLDVQRQMLDALARRSAAAGVTNIKARQGNAESLPYSDSMFDGA